MPPPQRPPSFLLTIDLSPGLEKLITSPHLRRRMCSDRRFSDDIMDKLQEADPGLMKLYAQKPNVFESLFLPGVRICYLPLKNARRKKLRTGHSKYLSTFKLLFIVVRVGVPSYYLAELSEEQYDEMLSLHRHHPNKHLSNWVYISRGRDV